MENNIEEKQVPLTVKQIVIYLIAVVMFCTSSMVAYNKMKNGQDDNARRISTVEVDQNTMKNELKTKDAVNQELKTQIAELKERISILETENKLRSK